jgi:hypothetical protein
MKKNDGKRGWGLYAIVFLALLLAGGAVRGQQETDFSKVQIKVTKVSGNIYMLQGEGGNIAASVGDDGIVIVDDQFAPLADKIHVALKGLGITDKRSVCKWRIDGDRTGQCAETIGDRWNGRERWLRENGGSAGTKRRLAGDYVCARRNRAPEW